MTGKQKKKNTTTAVLQERVKELTCLLRMTDIASEPGVSVEEILEQTVALLVAAWQYPDIAVARIVVDDFVHASPGFREGISKQCAAIMLQGVERGTIEVHYLEERPPQDEGPFLREERNLIEAVAHQLGAIVKRKQTELERSQLQEQLLHADRLATIGFLAAGVAHELNEPLGNILGFAELAAKCPELPDMARGDLSKIEKAALHAREIIKKLLVFARQMPPAKTQVDINRVVRDGIFFLEARCQKAGIEVVYALDPHVPRILADASQLNQVLVNLVVNALQAMPEGGHLQLGTKATDEHVVLRVSDTGAGMTRDVLDRVFVPFFTTKDVGEGTGLGLAVAHGIVASHGGMIHIESTPGQGTCVEVRLPVAPAREQQGNTGG